MDLDEPWAHGGCVFPRLESWTNENGVTLTDPVQGGLTLRQYYAGLVMQGLIPQMGDVQQAIYLSSDADKVESSRLAIKGLADLAVVIAGNLIKALEEGSK